MQYRIVKYVNASRAPRRPKQYFIFLCQTKILPLGVVHWAAAPSVAADPEVVMTQCWDRKYFIVAGNKQ